VASVLVVDDEPDIRYLTQLQLELDGHRVMTAADGVEALAAVQVEVPDVVLLDVMMPEVDGWAVLEQLKAHLDQRISSVKVLMMTALADDDHRLRGGIEGAVRYLVKPVSAADLRAAHDRGAHVVTTLAASEDLDALFSPWCYRVDLSRTSNVSCKASTRGEFKQVVWCSHEREGAAE